MLRRGTIANDLVRGEGYTETSSETREVVLSPTVTERDRDRDHARPVPRRNPIEVAD
jgi:hypothetical protein